MGGKAYLYNPCLLFDQILLETLVSGLLTFAQWMWQSETGDLLERCPQTHLVSRGQDEVAEGKVALGAMSAMFGMHTHVSRQMPLGPMGLERG